MNANGIEHHKRDKKMKILDELKNRLVNIQASKKSSTQLRIKYRKTFN